MITLFSIGLNFKVWQAYVGDVICLLNLQLVLATLQPILSVSFPATTRFLALS